MNVNAGHQHPDEGCELHTSCLDCPYPTCVEEHPGITEYSQRRGVTLEAVYTLRDEGYVDIVRANNRVVVVPVTWAPRRHESARHEAIA